MFEQCSSRFFQKVIFFEIFWLIPLNIQTSHQLIPWKNIGKSSFSFFSISKILKYNRNTRMHFSRMPTAHLSTVLAKKWTCLNISGGARGEEQVTQTLSSRYVFNWWNLQFSHLVNRNYINELNDATIKGPFTLRVDVCIRIFKNNRSNGYKNTNAKNDFYTHSLHQHQCYHRNSVKIWRKRRCKYWLWC